MKTRAWLVAPLLLIAVAACGKGAGGNGSIRPDDSPSAGGDGTQAGSRLQPLTFSNSDGSKASFGWLDTQLMQPCTFALVSSGLGACVPGDVFTVASDVLSDSHATSNPTFYLDPQCNGEAHGILVSEQSCLEYGLMRVTPPAEAKPYPGCTTFSGPAYYALEPYDLSKGKAYRYGVPDGGGACCSCNEITPAALKEGLKMYLYSAMTPEKAKATKLVTGVLNLP